MAGEPGQAILTILDQIIDGIINSRPQRTNGKSLANGYVLSQLVMGQMIDPKLYLDPWSPSVGSGAAVTPPAGANPGSAANPAPNPKVQRAIRAAFETSKLVDKMIKVTKDGSFEEYEKGERHLSFQYESIINAMQPLPLPSYQKWL